MPEQENDTYRKIASAIDFLQRHFREQPSLEVIASQVHLSPFHFQKLFTEWAGVSPKKFIQFLSIGRAKSLLKERQATLFEAAFESGLSGTGRLHDLFITIEGMTPGEFKNGGGNLSIHYSIANTPFGKAIVASTAKGICHLAFTDDEEEGLLDLKQQFPNAVYHNRTDAYQQLALSVFENQETGRTSLPLHLKGTPFQIKVWEALLHIPSGHLTSYAAIAEALQNKKASRAVGSAVGDNPVAYLIPCHRVIKSTGEFGQYHWGVSLKTAMIGWEAARASAQMEK